MKSPGGQATGAAVGASSAAVVIDGAPVPKAQLGGKGAALARLIEWGFPVPATGVVTVDAYRSVAAHPSLDELLAGMEARTESTGSVAEEDVDAVFAALPVADEMVESICEAARSVGAGGPIAVRSSATVEDLHGSSFAGQYRSFLNVDSSNPDAVMAAVRKVWSSLWYPAPVAYRRAFGIDDTDVAMAVVLMRMVPATAAGVVFTVDPGGSGGARIEAVDGLGESLVSGQRTPTAWVVIRPDREGEAPTAGEDPADLPTVPARAFELSLAVERRFGVPQDVEWAAVGDEVSLVQARPITTLESDDGFDTEPDEHELTTAGIVEMVPGVLPPLRWEVNRFLLEEAFRSVLDSLGIIRGTKAEDRPFVRRVRGRAAIDFDQLRDAAAGIPGAVEDLERQYFGQATSVRPEVKPPKRFRLERIRRDLRTLQTRRQVIDQAEVVVRATDLLRRRRPALEPLSDDEVLAYLRRLIDLGARGLAAELGVAAAGAAAYRRLELQLGTYLGRDAGPAAVREVTARSGAAINRSGDASAAVFGGPTWHEMKTVPPVMPGDAEAYTETKWEELKGRLKSLPGWTRRRILTGGFIDVRIHLVHRLISDVIEQVHRREAAKAAILELGGEVRRVHLELGRRLVTRGLLDQPSDVELLAAAELRSCLGGGDQLRPDVLRRRRNWLTRYEAEGSLPIRFVGFPDRTPAPLPEGNRLEGWAAGPGRRSGRARVVTNARDRFDRGEILVAEATDASWSPLFLKAAAVVVERGGPLSHAAILARELGVPAVLNVAGVTRVLDGQQVTVDGDLGCVIIDDGGGS